VISDTGSLETSMCVGAKLCKKVTSRSRIRIWHPWCWSWQQHKRVTPAQ